ncbi:MAG: DUF192 domain-containing protein [Candidatus Magasanikbacteria bacterium]
MKTNNNFKFYFILIFLGLAIFLFFWQRYYWTETIVSLKDQKLEVLIADSIYRQQKGLGGRDSINPYDGMIFPFSFPSKHSFVMRDMSFPIDIVWFYKGEVVDIAPNVPIEPNKEEYEYKKYTPRVDSDLVLELPSGWVKEHNLKIGDKMLLVED